MKNTKIMIAVVLVFIITWLFVGTIMYSITNMYYDEALTLPGVIVFMMTFGWIPSVIVGKDLNENYE